ncbi:protein-L-isoaspartate O-methyltransferase [candidate division WS6 bacterium RIFOXYC1_FULL_33_9]|nr:MAG: protein-L-isoaspartate O-methyltransferase [candidate division WS6 bacterium RIFOXYB1_FULL_33_15]OGC37196.1 MAG: protein-L-isoaspartate O-methyltransferase [candidate division WS6 bacterium RIFOXYC1_FULL_33_9]
MTIENNKNHLKQQKKYLLDSLKSEISDKRVLDAINKVPREEFLPKETKKYAYINIPLEIGFNQTISQPYIVAKMSELLEIKDTDKILDIGTGSGYQAAVLRNLCKEVISIEIIPQLAKKAEMIFNKLKYRNITVVNKNGREGYKEKAPYDKIICAAVSKDIPNDWKEQLTDDGIIVLPIYKRNKQVLTRIRKKDGQYFEENFCQVLFVPLV